MEIQGENKNGENVSDPKEGEVRCKYSSGNVDGLEKCIGCGVGYRYIYICKSKVINFR